MTRGNLNYVELLAGGTAAEFLRMRDADALGADRFFAKPGETAAAEATAQDRLLVRMGRTPAARNR